MIKREGQEPFRQQRRLRG